VSGSPSARATVTASAVAAETSARRHMGQRRRAWATETAREPHAPPPAARRREPPRPPGIAPTRGRSPPTDAMPSPTAPPPPRPAAPDRTETAPGPGDEAAAARRADGRVPLSRRRRCRGAPPYAIAAPPTPPPPHSPGREPSRAGHTAPSAPPSRGRPAPDRAAPTPPTRCPRASRRTASTGRSRGGSARASRPRPTPEPALAHRHATPNAVHHVHSGHRADDCHPRHDRPIPVGSHAVLPSPSHYASAEAITRLGHFSPADTATASAPK